VNKTLKTILIISGVGAIAYLGYRYFQKQIGLLENYDYKIIGFKIKNLSKSNLVFDIKTRFFNKSKIEATIEKIFVKIIIEGSDVGYITENKSFLIPAQGSSDIDLQIAINPQDIAKNILGIVFGGVKKKDINFTMDGYANIRSGFVRTTLPIKYSDVVSSYL
jgi:LEA14-like dessication related protein